MIGNQLPFLTHTMPLLISKILLSLPSLRFPHLPFSFLYSTSNAILSTPTTKSLSHQQEDRHNAMAEFLLKECGISHSQLSTVAKRRPSLFRSKTIHRAQQALQLFRDSGFNQHQVTRTIIKLPYVLESKVDTRLKPNIEFMKALGLIGQDLANVLSTQPRILGSSLDKNLSPKISLLLDLFGSKTNLVKAVKRQPGLLVCNTENLHKSHVKSNLEILKQAGLQGEILLCLISRKPQILSISEISLKFIIDYVRNIGIAEGSKIFAEALMVVHIIGPKMLYKKLKHMANFGLLESEIIELFKKRPTVFTLSIDKIQKNMDFLVHIAGFQPHIVINYHSFLTYSVENRMMPRYKVYESLTAKQPCVCHSTSLASLFTLSEQKFTQKFLRSSEIVKAFESYKGKSIN